MKALVTLTLLGLPSLGACADTFEITPVMIDGRLAFVDRRTPARCVSSVMVMRDADTQAPDEREEAWRARTTAWIDHGGYGCDDTLPLFYGQPLMGNAASTDGEFVPRPLETGVTYKVTVGSGATDEAVTRFRLLTNGQVENLGPAVP